MMLIICLKAQLIARAFAQRIYQHDRQELGFTLLRLLNLAIADNLF
jgi:GMP synthase-like glutamine amidotransferase